MLCPTCGTNLTETTERNAEGTVEKKFHCYKCGVVQIPDTDEPTPSVQPGRGSRVMLGVLSALGGLATLVIVALVLIFTLSAPIGAIITEFGWSPTTTPSWFSGVNADIPTMYYVIRITQFIIVCAVSGYAGYKVQTLIYPPTDAQREGSFEIGCCWMLGAAAIIFASLLVLAGALGVSVS